MTSTPDTGLTISRMELRVAVGKAHEACPLPADAREAVDAIVEETEAFTTRVYRSQDDPQDGLPPGYACLLEQACPGAYWMLVWAMACDRAIERALGYKGAAALLVRVTG